MKLVVLGGTVFLSRAVVAEAVRRGHQVTCAHRARSGRVPDGAAEVVLDRDDPGAIGWLARVAVDAVVDVATQSPRWVAESGVATLVAVPQTVLAEHGVQPGSGPESLPPWVPQPEMAGFGGHDVTASLQAGLVVRERRVLCAVGA